MSKMQAKIVKTTHGDLSTTYALKVRVKTRWYQLWSDWDTVSSFCDLSEAEEALEAYADSWSRPFIQPVSEDITFVEAIR